MICFPVASGAFRGQYQNQVSFSWLELPPMALVPATPSFNQPAKPHRWPIFGFSSTRGPQGCGSWLTAKAMCLAGLGLKLQGRRRLKERFARRVLVLSSSEFEHLFEEGPQSWPTWAPPVSGLTQHEQGRKCQEWAKRVLQEQNPEAEIFDPEVGLCCDGTKRGRNFAPYDFLINGRRVEIKSGRMVWHAGKQCWMARFTDIKLQNGQGEGFAFDDLYLVLFSPQGLHLIKHDLTTGTSRDGERTTVRGHCIYVYGSRANTCWEEALPVFLQKLCEQGNCSLIATELFSGPGFRSTLFGREPEHSEHYSRRRSVLDDIPMSNMSSAKRGMRLQEIALAVDRKMNPLCKFSRIQANRVGTQKRGTSNAPADWIRDKTRVEAKSGGLVFNRGRQFFQCKFDGIKTELFDELWLVMYSLKGIWCYRSRSIESLGLCKCGAMTRHSGLQKVFTGRRGELEPLKALKTIDAKIRSKGCELVAMVEWDNGAPTPHHEEGKGRLGSDLCSLSPRLVDISLGPS